jgi:hypothetical protein
VIVTRCEEVDKLGDEAEAGDPQGEKFEPEVVIDRGWILGTNSQHFIFFVTNEWGQ